MWARLGRFLEIYYGPKFWDFQRKSDFQKKSKKTFDKSHSFVERVTFVESVLTKGPGYEFNIFTFYELEFDIETSFFNIDIFLFKFQQCYDSM
jgi:hypothetical protein